MLVNEIPKFKPKKTLDGEGLPSQVLNEYEKDLKYFTAKKPNATSKPSTTRKTFISHILPSLETRRVGIVEWAEEQRKIRHSKKASMDQSKLQASVLSILYLGCFKSEEGRRKGNLTII